MRFGMERSRASGLSVTSTSWMTSCDRTARESAKGRVFRQARGLLVGIFNWVRSAIDKHDADETAVVGSRALWRTRPPVCRVVRYWISLDWQLKGKRSRNSFAYRTLTSESERKEFLPSSKRWPRPRQGEKFVTEVEMDYGDLQLRGRCIRHAASGPHHQTHRTRSSERSRRISGAQSRP